MQFDSIQKAGTVENYSLTKISIIAGMSFLGISGGLILLLWFFMISDTLLGVWKAGVLGGWSGITAQKFWLGMGTKIAILFVPLSLALTGELAGYDLNIFVLTTMYMLIANDAMSCYTNLLSIRQKKNHENKDLVELLINTLRMIIYNSAKTAINKIKNSNDSEDKRDS